MKKQNWISKTKQFSAEEVLQLQALDAKTLVVALSSSSPVIALRGLAEVLLNGDQKKFASMIADKRFNEIWRNYQADWGCDNNDDTYAAQIEEKILELE